MKFRAHDTFFIRKGWLYKGIKNVIKDKYVFMGANENPIDVLGIGSNMVKSLRYWLQAVDITKEPTTGKRYQELTPFGHMIYKYDKYMEEMGTLLLTHYNLAINNKEATAWYYFFNEFKPTEFTRDDFIIQLNNYVCARGENPKSERILIDEFNCIIGTYISKNKMDLEKINPENNIECPLNELQLIGILDKKNKVYKKNLSKIDNIHPLIALAIILHNAESSEIKIQNILNDKCNIGKILNLDIIGLISILSKIELMGYIKVIRTAGLDIININDDIMKNNKDDMFLWCIEKYYELINN